jgi:hypothetical protein
MTPNAFCAINGARYTSETPYDQYGSYGILLVLDILNINNNLADQDGGPLRAN